MALKTAAAYLGLSAPSARRLLRREAVLPIRLGLRLVRWRRADLDALVARLPARRRDGAAAGAEIADAADAADAALARVERRAGRGQGVGASPASSPR
jgi:predicted DNA-binding transcriptional regulator AlpA